MGVHATIEGETVVDLSWGRGTTGPWASDTLVCPFSATKGLSTMVVQLLVDRGLLDVEERVATYWPEFGCAGKEDTLVAHVLNHTSGCLTFPGGWRLVGDGSGLADARRMAAGLAAAAPFWEPGTVAAYHSLSFGWLVGELVERVDGRTIGRVLSEDIAGPLGLDVFLGVPAEHEGRVADVVVLEGSTEGRDALGMAAAFLPDDEADTGRLAHAIANHPAVRRAGLAAGGAVVSAGGLSGAYALLANDGGGVFSPESIRLFTTPRPTTLGGPTEYGLGYLLYRSEGLVPGIEGVFGHGGAGGNCGVADPDRRLSYAYVKNRMLTEAVDLVPLRALYRCLVRMAKGRRSL